MDGIQPLLYYEIHVSQLSVAMTFLSVDQGLNEDQWLNPICFSIDRVVQKSSVQSDVLLKYIK